MSKTQILVHRNDREIDIEFNQVLASATGLVPVFHFHSELKDTINSATAFQPSILMIELEDNLENVKATVDECVAVAPDVTVVGICEVIGATGNDSNLLMNALKLGVEDFIRRPISSGDLRGLLERRISSRREKKATSGSLISFISNKGGVGKSTCAVNVAVELASRYPEKVLLFDGSLQMGVCAAQLNLEPQATITDAWRQRDRLDPQLFRQLTTVHESGLHLMAAPSSAIEAAEIDDAFISRMLLMARRTYDYVIIDTFPLFDRTIMAVLDLSDFAYIVAENVVPTLKTIRGFFQLLTEVGFSEDKWRVVANRFSSQGGSPSLSEVERYIGRSVDHVIPWDKKIILSANVGQPLLTSKIRWNKSSKALQQLVDSIEAEIANQEKVGFGSTPPEPMDDASSPANSGPYPSLNDLEGAG